MSNDPVRFGAYWHFPDGTTLPVISGGSDDGDPGGDAGGDTEPGDDGGLDEGQGQPPQPDPAAEATKWKALARKHEAQAKANAEAAQRLKDMENAGKSETEKLQALLDDERSKAKQATVKALKLSVAAEKGIPASLAKFLPDLEDEVDMMQAADELLEASGTAGTAGQPTRQPKSNLTNPLKDDDGTAQRDALVNSMLGKAV
jgi:hypothetical protein